MNIGYVVLMTPVILSLLFGNITKATNDHSRTEQGTGIVEASSEQKSSDNQGNSQTGSGGADTKTDSDTNRQQPTGVGVVVTVERVTEPDGSSEPSIDELIDQHFGSAAASAKRVMQCESGGRSDAVGDTKLAYWLNNTKYGESYGLFQIRYLPGRPSPDQLLDPAFNIEYAANMHHGQGFRPWTCARKLGIR